MAKKAKGPQGPKRVNSRKSSARKPTTKKPNSPVKKAAGKKTDDKKPREAGQYSKVDVPSPAEQSEKKKARKKLGKGAKPASPVAKGSKKSQTLTDPKPRKFRDIDRSKYPPDPITWRQRRDGKWVGWANEPMKFKVEAADIVKATTRDGRKCVLAMALRRCFFGLLDGFVIGKYVSKIYSDNGNRIVEYDTPAKLRDAVREFDRYGNWPLDVNEEVRFLPFSLNRREGRHDKRKTPKPGRKPSEYAVIVDGFKRIAPNVCSIAAGNV